MVTHIKLSKTFLVPIIIVSLIGGLFFSAPQARAQVNQEAMLAQIQQLLALITSLQQQIMQMNGTTPAVGTSQSEIPLKVGTKIQTSRVVNARSGAGVNASWVNSIDAFSRGQIVDGPRSADGFTWWLVRYDSGTQGWSIGSALRGIEMPNNSNASADAQIVAITNYQRPTIRGTAQGTDFVGFTLSNDSGDKVYGSGNIRVVNGAWSHSVPMQLDQGVHTVYVYINNKLVEKDSFLVSDQVDVADEDLSIEIISPRGGTYTYGDTLTVRWDQTGSVPKGSVACVTLYDSSAGGGFAFPGKGGCVDVAGEEPTRSISGKIERTSGYNLAPGKYRLEVVILGPSSPSGKDGATLTKDSRTITIYDENQDMIDDLLKQVSSLTHTCNVKTNKSVYKLGEIIDISWTSKNASRMSFVIPRDGRDGLALPGDKLPLSGSAEVTASVLGNPVITMRAISSTGQSLDCTVRVQIESNDAQDEDQDKIDDLINQVNQLQKVYAVGVYEASNASHSFCESGWGDVTVNISPDLAGNFVTLVLSAYEPVRWNIKNPAGVDINRIILSGYNAQHVSGAIGRAEIEHRTFYNKDRYTSGSGGQGAFYDGTAGWPSKIYHWASQCPTSNAIPAENRRYLTGSNDYAYAYTTSDSGEFLSKVKGWTGREVTSFQGVYSGTSFTVSKTQVLGVSTSSQDEQLRDILVSLTDLLKQVK